MRTCLACNAEIRKGDKFCLECGAKTTAKSKNRVILVVSLVICLFIVAGAFFVSRYYETEYTNRTNQYNSLASQYNSLVSQYNSLVSRYNSLVKTVNTR